MPASLLAAIERLSKKIGGPIRLMEVCGTHTVAVFRHGIRALLPENIKLLSGPGCPVCVTPAADVDAAIALSKAPGAVLATFGDMMRVPSSGGSLNDAKAEGGDVRVVYSPLDALKIASENSGKRVVFFATGFETTSPLVAATILQAEKDGTGNFFVYPAHKLVPPALRALLDSPEVNVDGFILPGHVSSIIGSMPYEFIASDFKMPSVITGFDARDILEGILMLLGQMESKSPSVEIQYASVVKKEGNPKAVATMHECFEPSDADWRGIGVIPRSGLELREKYGHRDIKRVMDPLLRALKRSADLEGSATPAGCRCGNVLRGVIAPSDCPLFGKRCTPDTPVGPCMVSTEGSCAAYYRYGRWRSSEAVRMLGNKSLSLRDRRFSII
jgi:hydrogenase expression/formation protein HypD